MPNLTYQPHIRLQEIEVTTEAILRLVPQDDKGLGKLLLDNLRALVAEDVKLEFEETEVLK